MKYNNCDTVYADKNRSFKIRFEEHTAPIKN